MTTCGMYNGSGKFTKDLGIPSKSGVAGGLLSVVPGIGAIATWSPKLNDEGNTVKGIAMVQKLGHIYCNFNLFHRAHNKKDVLTRPFQTVIKTTIAACECASNGNMEGLSRLEILGVDLNQGDYDKRTPLHLAVSSGHFDIIQFLIKKKVNPNPVDRWQATPLDDAKSDEIINFLTTYGAVKGGHSLDY